MVMAEVARPAEEPKRTEQAHDRDQPREAAPAARRARRTSRTRPTHASVANAYLERAKWSGDSANAYLERATKGSRDKVENFGAGCVLV